MSEDLFTVGNEAPDFELKDQNGKPFSLSSLKGQRVLLSFIPKSNKVDGIQLKELEKSQKTLKKYKTTAVGLTIDSVDENKKWAKKLKVKDTPLLSDSYPEGDVAKKYNSFDEATGSMSRANIVINEDQQIIFFKEYDAEKVPDIGRVIDYLKLMV
jgi:peroxiredoxin